MFVNHNATYLHSEKNMPANLNALIRYRTIDSCLSNPYRKWTIRDLMEACSLALKEHRGIYTGISERTIREDIRVIRSDILGFNAPIAQKDGNYYYEDQTYSIFNVSIKDSELLARVLEFILELQSETDHPGMEEIIKQITNALSDPRVSEKSESDEKRYTGHPSFLRKTKSISPLMDFNGEPDPESEDEPVSEDKEIFEDLQEPGDQPFQLSIFHTDLRWSGILNLI